MEVVIRGIMLSQHPEALKQALFTKLLASWAPISAQECKSVVDIAVSWLLGPNKFEQDMGEFVLTRLGELKSTTTLDSILTMDNIVTYLSTSEAPMQRIVNGMRVLLKLKDKTSEKPDWNSIAALIRPQLLNEGIVPEVALALARLLLELPQCCPANVDLAAVGVDWLARVPFDLSRLSEFDNDVELLMRFLLWTWNNFSSGPILSSLSRLFRHLSAPHRTPSIALCYLLAAVPPAFIPLAAPLAAAIPRDEDLETALHRVLRWPLTPQVALWAIALLDSCRTGGRLATLARTVHFAVEPVCAQLAAAAASRRSLNDADPPAVEALRDGALAVLETMLLGYQHAPDAFHKIVGTLPRVIDALNRAYSPLVSTTSTTATVPSTPTQSAENNTKPMTEPPLTHANVDMSTSDKPPMISSKIISALVAITTSPTAAASEPAVAQGNDTENGRRALTRLCELSHILMQQFTGYPELYAPLLRALSEAGRPDPPAAADVATRLRQVAWTTGGTAVTFGTVPLTAESRSAVGAAGLSNLGNTCYMNSFLQVLFVTDPLRAALFQTWKEGSNTAPVAMQLRRVFAYLTLTNRQAIVPRLFRDVLPPQWRNGRQQDASEFGKFLLDRLETELRPPTAATAPSAGSVNVPPGNINSIVASLFGGMMASVVRCRKCGRESRRDELFWDLQLPFYENDNDDIDVPTMLKRLFVAEPLEGDNRYRCESETCKNELVEADRSAFICRAPEHLVLSLNRFAFDAKTLTRSKILTDVKYPVRLRLPVQTETRSAYISADSDVVMQDIQNTASHAMYVLYAVIFHSGTSAEHGHYYCYARHSEQALKAALTASVLSPAISTANDFADDGDMWYLFNDSHVSTSSFTAFTSVSKRFRHDLAYMLFYRRVPDVHGEAASALAASTAAALASVEVPAPLAQEVYADNARFLEEREQQARDRSARHSTFQMWTNSWRGWKDDENDGNPPPSCSGGGGFSLGGPPVGPAF